MEIPKGLFQIPAPGIQAMTLDTPEGATQINALAAWKLFLLDKLDPKNQSLLDLVSGAGLRSHDPGIVHRVEIVELQIREYLIVNEGSIQIEPVTDAHEAQVKNLFRRVAYNFLYQNENFPSMKEIIETEIMNNDGAPELCRNSMASILTDPDELGNFYSTVINSNHLDRDELSRRKFQLDKVLTEDTDPLINIFSFHDVGKAVVPLEYLQRPSNLTEEEFAAIKLHAAFGGKIAREIFGDNPPLCEKAVDVAECHHENWDGTGYLNSLKEEEIPLLARVCRILDVWEALSSPMRSYRKPLSLPDLTLEMLKGKDQRFDPYLLELILPLLYTSFLPSAVVKATGESTNDCNTGKSSP